MRNQKGNIGKETRGGWGQSWLQRMQTWEKKTNSGGGRRISIRWAAQYLCLSEEVSNHQHSIQMKQAAADMIVKPSVALSAGGEGQGRGKVGGGTTLVKTI